MRDRLMPDRTCCATRRSTSRHCTSTIPSPGNAQARRPGAALDGLQRSAGARRHDHPFETSFSVTDVRLTTRYHEDYFPAGLYAAMHELRTRAVRGRGRPELQRTPLGLIRSSAIHEVQSRLWENMVGRGRAFSTVLAARRGSAFGRRPDRSEAGCAVQGGERRAAIDDRIEGDEATYGLHIVLRFELERLLLARELEVDDLPAAWNARMQEYLGVTGRIGRRRGTAGRALVRRTDRLLPGLMRSHLIAGQLWERVRADLSDLDDQLAAGELQGLRGWLREKGTSAWLALQRHRAADAGRRRDRWRWRRSSNI